MAEAGTLHDAFIDELRDAYDAEKQLTEGAAEVAKAASSPELRAGVRDAISRRRRDRSQRLEEVFASLDEKVRGKHCDGIAGIIEEGKSVMEEDFDDDDDGRLPDCGRPARRALRDGGLRHARRVGAGDGSHRAADLLAADSRRGEGRRREAVGAGRRRHQSGSRRRRAS